MIILRQFGRISIEVLGLSFMFSLWLIFEEIGLYAQLNDMFTLIVRLILQSFFSLLSFVLFFLVQKLKGILISTLEFTSGLISQDGIEKDSECL